MSISLSEASRTAELAPLYEQLRPRSGGPGREDVALHQRARLHAAMIEAVGEHGYGATTIRELTALAGVSTRTLYTQFAGKQDCFLSAYDIVVRRAARRIVAAQGSERDWRARLRRAFEAFAREVVREPKAARLALVEAFGAGPAAIERMEHASGLFEAMVVTSFERAPDRLVPPPMVVKGIVAGVARVARVRLLDGRSAELPALADELLAWVLSYRSPAVARLEGVELERRLARRGAVPRAGGVAGERHDRVEDGAGDARTRILQAAAKIAASRGALELTPRSISAAAGVSGETFAELFDHCGECFLAGLEHVCTQALERATRAGFAADEDWPDGVQRALATLVYQVATDPVLANVAFVEVFALGPAGVRCRESLMRGFAEALRAGAPPSQRPSELVAEATVGAVWGIMHHYVAHGAASRLPALTGQLSYVALAPMLGAEDAIERIMTEQTRGRASGRASRASVRADSTAPNHKTSRNIP